MLRMLACVRSARQRRDVIYQWEVQTGVTGTLFRGKKGWGHATCEQLSMCEYKQRRLSKPPHLPTLKKTQNVLTQRCWPSQGPAPLCKFDQKEPSFTAPVQTALQGSRQFCCLQRLCCLKHLWGLCFRSQWGREPEPSVDQGPLPSFFWLHPEARRRLEIAQTCGALFGVFSSYNFLKRATNQQRWSRTMSRGPAKESNKP